MIPRTISVNQRSGCGWRDRQVGIPYNIPPVANAAKNSFSAVYSESGICGALGLLDQDCSKESDMVQARVVEVF